MLYSLKDIAVRRGGRCILDIKKLEIAAGNVYSLVGPNGAGKSTLLNILGFLLKPDCGTMLCNDELVQNSAKNYHQLRQRIVLVEQYPILFTGPVWKNIDFALKIRKIPRQQRSTRIAEVLERVGMQTFANADAHKLSGGETKRIALARALAIEPEVLLCDEPTANVDSENQERIIEILESCNTQQQTTLIFASHFLSQAQRLADCSIILQNGSVSSVGSDNIFTIHRADSNEEPDMWTAGERLLLTIPQNKQTVGRTSCKIQIDPRCITLSRALHPSSPAGTRWNGKIVRIASENKSARVTVDCGIRVDVLLSHEAYVLEQYLLEEEVVLTIPAEELSFF